MSLSYVLRRGAMLTAVALALTAPAALAEPFDPISPTAEHARQQELAHLRKGDSIRKLDAARAQERYYTSYGTSRPSTKPAATVGDSGDGVAGVPFALSVFGALIVGLGAGSGLHLVRSRHRDSAGLAV